MRKLIIFILFLALTVAGIDFIYFKDDGQMSMATAFAMITKDPIVYEDNAPKTVTIEEKDAEGNTVLVPVIDVDSTQAEACRDAFRKSEHITYIQIPFANLIKVATVVCIVHGEENPGIYILGEEAINSGFARPNEHSSLNAIPSYMVTFWLTLLFLIILLPKRISKRKVRKLAQEVAEDFELQPQPRRRRVSRRNDDYDDYDDYDD